jgi:nucleoside-diphosphate-sugar epimerase
MCRAYLEVLRQPAWKVNGQIFNVGADNMKVSEIAEIVASQVDGPVEVKVEPTQDQRSYRISSDRIAEAIGFRPKFTINDAVADLQRAFINGDLPNSLTDPTYFNIRRMNEILDATDSDGKS